MVRIDDVARMAGVSSSTVSYALSGKRSISDGTRARVLEAVEALGYRPHAGAAALASARTKIVGLMLPLRPGVNTAVVMEVASGVITRARELDHDVLIVTADETDAIDRVVRSSMVDSLLLMEVEARDARLATLTQVQQPVVLIGLPEDPHGLSCVDFDFERAGELAVDHLTSLGLKRFALLAAPQEVQARRTSFAVRLNRGFERACATADVPARVLPTGMSISDGSARVEELLTQVPDLDALVVHNEAALPGVFLALAQHHRPVNVVAIAPIGLARSIGFPMDLINIPAAEMGRVAVDMVIRGLDPAETAPTLIAPRLIRIQAD